MTQPWESEMDQTEWERRIADIRSGGDDLDRALEASMALKGLTDRSRIPELEHLIQDDDFFMREAAASPLINLKGLGALPLLLQALERGTQPGHDHDGLALEITELIESHKTEAGPLLLEMLRDPKGQTRSHAAWLLGFISDVVSPEVLTDVLKDLNPNVRSSAVGSLSSFKDHPGVLEAMLPLLDDGEEQVRVDAASALGYFGDRRAIPALRDALSDPSERVRRFAESSLGLLGDRRES